MNYSHPMEVVDLCFRVWELVPASKPKRQDDAGIQAAALLYLLANEGEICRSPGGGKVIVRDLWQYADGKRDWFVSHENLTVALLLGVEACHKHHAAQAEKVKAAQKGAGK